VGGCPGTGVWGRLVDVTRISRRGPHLVWLSVLAVLLALGTQPVTGEPLSSASATSGPAPVVLPRVVPTVFRGDTRNLERPRVIPASKRLELEQPDASLDGAPGPDTSVQSSAPLANAPGPSITFAGLNHDSWGDGWPPDTNGDVGPIHYIQTVNTSVGIFRKSDGAVLAAFTFNTLFSSAATGTPCDNGNQGDPVVVYDGQADRWIISDFAWSNFSSGAMYQCFAVSITGNPVSGGWYFYAVQTDPGGHIPDYPKLGVWPDGIYMSANIYNTTGSQAFQNVRVWAFNRSDLESGSPLDAVSFDLPAKSQGVTIYSLLPSNLRGVAPPAGRPNLFASIWGAYAARVWKFHVDWTTPASSTFTGPSNVSIGTFSVGPGTVPQPAPGNALDTLTYRVMMQNQYRRLGSQESLWLAHTVGNGSGIASVRWYQLNVSGGTVVTSGPVQQGTFNPDSNHRFMPSLAVDGSGNMAVGYSVSSSAMYPAIRYAGRLVTDPLNTLGQGETTLWAGTGAQTNTCGGNPCQRWGDYSAMSVDPVDDCTFWYTNEYYAANGGNWQTRIGSFKYPSCTTDETAPSVVAPKYNLAVSGLGTTTIPTRVYWSATDPSGIASYQVQRQVNGGAWAAITLATPTTAAVTHSLTVGSTYRYRVIATDTHGNASAWIYGRTVKPLLAEQTNAAVSYTGTWTGVASASASGGSLRYATAAGASATFTFTGSGVGWVSHLGPDRGSANVYIDGVFKKTVSLYSTTYQPKRIVYAFAWTSNAAHTIKIVVVGTAGHPRVDVDAFGKLLLL
jgi:hypothetical protein